MTKKFDLKIYWIATIWPKWQIMIPKEARDENILVMLGGYIVFILDEKWFWIWKNDKTLKELKTMINIKIVSNNIKLNSKNQFVIPVSIRTRLNLKPWDNLITIWKWNWWLWFIKNNDIEYLFEYIKLNLN